MTRPTKIESFERDMAEIEALIEQSRAKLTAGGTLEFSELAGRVTTLCQGVRDTALILADPDAVRRRLEEIVHNLGRLEHEIICQAAENGDIPGNPEPGHNTPGIKPKGQ